MVRIVARSKIESTLSIIGDVTGNHFVSYFSSMNLESTNCGWTTFVDHLSFDQFSAPPKSFWSNKKEVLGVDVGFKKCQSRKISISSRPQFSRNTSITETLIFKFLLNFDPSRISPRWRETALWDTSGRLNDKILSYIARFNLNKQKPHVPG